MKINKSLSVIFSVVLLDLIGVGILLPIIPILLTDSGSHFFLLSSRYSLKEGYILLGILTGIYSLMQFFAAPVLGQLSDRVGRKKVLVLSLLGTAGSYVLFAIGVILGNIPLLFISRAMDGITGGNISVAQAVIADTSAPDDRAKNFALIGAAYGLGFILGPLIGSKLSDPSVLDWFNAATPFWFAAFLAMVNVALVTLVLKETYRPSTKRKIDWLKPWKNFSQAFTRGALRKLFIVEFLYCSGFAFFATFLGVFLIYNFSMNQSEIGNFFSILGMWIVFAQAVTTRQLARFFKENQLLKTSLMATSIAIALLLLSHQRGYLYGIIPFITIFNGLSLSNLNGLISRSVGNHEQGEILGLNSSVQAAAQAIPPILSGFVAATFIAVTPIMVGAGLIFISAVIFLVNKKIN